MVKLGMVSIAFDLHGTVTFMNDQLGLKVRVRRMCTARAFFDAHYNGFVIWDMDNSSATHRKRPERN